MSIFKKIKKTFKKTIKAPVKALGLDQSGGQFQPQQAEMGAAQVIEPPKTESVDTETDSDTEAGKKKIKAKGKKSLSVARTSGGGINI